MSRPGLFYKQSSRKALGFLVPWVPVGARGCPWVPMGGGFCDRAALIFPVICESDTNQTEPSQLELRPWVLCRTLVIRKRRQHSDLLWERRENYNGADSLGEAVAL